MTFPIERHSSFGADQLTLKPLSKLPTGFPVDVGVPAAKDLPKIFPAVL